MHHRDPLIRIKESIVVDNTTQCHNWSGYTDRGYGYLHIYGKKTRVHRFILEQRIGRKLKPSELACHRCDNPTCCNPNHLFVGTQQDNIADKMIKNRQAVGESVGTSVLTKDIVITLRAEFKTGEYSVASLARKSGLNENTVYDVIKQKTWKHI